MAKNKVITYEDFLERYESLVKRSNDITKSLEKTKFSIKPSIIKKRKELKVLLDDISQRLYDYEEFATNAATYDNKTLVNFMAKFYSYYYNKRLKIIEIYDNKYSKFAEHAYLVVTADDYSCLVHEFNFERAVNSDKVLKRCKNQEFLYLTGRKKVQIMDGLRLSEEFEQFDEIEEVIHSAIAYKLNNRDLQNKACLELALDDYISRNEKVQDRPQTNGMESSEYQAMDSDLVADISRTVQEVMDSEDREKNMKLRREQKNAQTRKEARRQSVQETQQFNAQTVRETAARTASQTTTRQDRLQSTPQTGAHARRDVTSVGIEMLYRLNDMVRMEQQDVNVTNTQRQAQQVTNQVQHSQVQQTPQQPQQTSLTEEPTVNNTDTAMQQTQTTSDSDLQSTREFDAVKVTGVEDAPLDKSKQYKAVSSVLLDMLDNMMSLDDDDQKRLKK